MRVTALKPITPRTVSKFENSDLWYLPSLCTSLYDIFINWERTSLAYDKVQMTKARLTLSPGSRVMLVPIPLVMRGVPAQIFFAVPGDKIWPAEIVWDLVQLTLDHPLQVELELDLLAGRGQMEQEAKCCQRPKRPHQNPIFVVSYVRFSSRLTFWENLSSESLPAITEVCSKSFMCHPPHHWSTQTYLNVWCNCWSLMSTHVSGNIKMWKISIVNSIFKSESYVKHIKNNFSTSIPIVTFCTQIQTNSD